MATKRIDPRKNRKGLMSIDSREKMIKRIKNNYALFGCTDSFYVMDFALAFHTVPRVAREFIDVEDCIRYKGFRDGNGNIKLDTNLDSYKDNQCSYKVSSDKLYVSNEDSYKFYCRDMSILSEAAIEFDSYENTVGFSCYTEYTENDTLNKSSKITTISIDDNTDKISIENRYGFHMVIIFPNVKSAPIVRFYNLKDLDTDKKSYISQLVNFEDTEALYNSYYRKCDITVEERTIVSQNSNIECMKYSDKADDVLKYMKHESYVPEHSLESNSDLGLTDKSLVEFKSDLGITAGSYNAYSDDERYHLNIYHVKYKDHPIYGVINTINNSDEKIIETNILYSKRLKYLADGVEEENYISKHCTEVQDQKVFDFISEIYNKLISECIAAKIGDTFEFDNLGVKIFSDNKENRIFAIVSNDLFSIDMQVIDDSIVYYTISASRYGVPSTDIYLVDTSYSSPVIIFHISKEYNSTTEGLVTSINYEDKNRLRYYLSNKIDTNTGKLKSVWYSGPEATVSVYYDENGKPILKYLDSLIYAASDHVIYIRDELGIPSPLSIH